MRGRRFIGPAGLSDFNASVRDTLVSQTIRADANRFRASMTAAPVSRARLVTATVAPLAARRSPDESRRAAGSVFLLACERGRGEIRHRAGTDVIAPGRLVVVPGAEAFEVAYPVTSRVVFVVLPEPEVTDRFPALDGPIRSHELDPLARRVSRRWGELATLAGTAATAADADDLGAVLDATLHLALRHTVGDLAGDPLRAIRVEATVLADQHVSDPALTPAWVAGRLGVSVRQLHRAFEGSDTSAAAMIRARRVAACARALDDPAEAGRTVTELALRYGFASSSHLGVWFRAQYGMTPTAWRGRDRRHGSDEVPART